MTCAAISCIMQSSTTTCWRSTKLYFGCLLVKRRHPTEALEVLQQSFLPLREKLISYLQTCVERGSIRPNVDLPLAVDQLTGMLLSGMIRRHVSQVNRGYSRKRYIEGCVDLWVRGVSTAASSVSRTSSPE